MTTEARGLNNPFLGKDTKMCKMYTRLTSNKKQIYINEEVTRRDWDRWIIKMFMKPGKVRMVRGQVHQ